MSVTLQSDRLLITNTNNRWVHKDGSNLMGFLNTSAGWDMYVNNSGQIWTANYGWLHDYLFNATSNCTAGNYTISSVVNCYGSGNIVTAKTFELQESGGSTVYPRVVQSLTNCNCACDCL
jgi:hypothetical protein